MGWELGDLADEVGIPAASITDPRSKKYEIEIKKLQKIAKVLELPLTALFLPAPPKESKLVDFRKLPKDQQKLSKETYRAINKARYWQAVGKDLLQGQRRRLPSIKRYSINDSPYKVADIERKRLGFGSNLEIQNADDLYNKLIDAIESRSIFVCQFNLPLKETRGFTLPDGPPHAIAVNTADRYQARSFTLLHEYAHVLLRKEGICLPNPGTSRQRIEKWCNNFAGAFLMPAPEFFDRLALHKKNQEPSQIVQRLSSDFKVSRMAVMVHIMRLVPYTALAKYCRENYDEYAPQLGKRSRSRTDSVTLCKNQRGSNFIRLVLDSHEQRLIDYSDVINFLDLDLDKLPKLEEKVYGIAT